MINIKKILTITLIPLIFSAFTINTYAADKLDTKEGWDAQVDFVESMVDASGENIAQLVGKFLYGLSEFSFTVLCPDCTSSGATISENTEIPEYMKLGLVGITDNQITAMFNNQPYVDVVAHLANEWVPGFSGTNSAYASGYDDLANSGISNLWSITRNVGYVFYVVVMIVIGFMIMFRNRIGGQAMVTVGNSIPKLIFSLIILTFSFAIMGLLIDFGGLITNLIKSELGTGVDINNPVQLFTTFLANNYKGEGAEGSLGIANITTTIIMGIFGTEAKTASVASLITGLVVLGIVLFGAIKLWIVLIKAYLGIIIDTVISPLSIVVSAIPGNTASSINIFKSALRNILVFPLAYAIVNLPYYMETKGVTLTFPTSLGGTSDATSTFIMAIVKIVAIYAACSAPALLSSLIPSSTNKVKQDVRKMAGSKLNGIPLIGGLIK